MKINRGSEKKISLCIQNEGLSLFLTALLREWGFCVNPTCPEHPDELLLAEENCSHCAAHRKRIDLINSAYFDSDQVNRPIAIEQLWRVLEKHYHLPPRHHLRLSVDLPIGMEIRGQEQPGRLTNLSPAGARLSLPRELASGELFPIVLPLAQRTLQLTAKIIYINTFPDRDNRYDAGILFERISSEDKALLRGTITLTVFSSIRQQLPRWAFEVGINQFDLSPELRQQL
ncbi:MAG: PilZ domain-containing protein [Desulfuromonadales bacterium]|nr:PilZ domain-containing protein [Desulfuromonadales bacterium]